MDSLELYTNSLLLIALIYLGSQLPSFKTAQHVHLGCHVSFTNGLSEIF